MIRRVLPPLPADGSMRIISEYRKKEVVAEIEKERERANQWPLPRSQPSQGSAPVSFHKGHHRTHGAQATDPGRILRI